MKIQTILEDCYGNKKIVYNGDNLTTASNIQCKYIKQMQKGKLPEIKATYLEFSEVSR